MITSKIVYLGGLSCESMHVRSGEKIITDAPVDNNGKGEAFSPTDLAATSLANCALTIMGIKAQNENIALDGTEVDLTKIMSDDSPRRIVKIALIFNMNASLNEQKQKEFERVAKNCPVALSLHPDIEQDFTFNWK